MSIRGFLFVVLLAAGVQQSFSQQPFPVIVMVNGSLPTNVMADGSIAGRNRLRDAGIGYVTWDTAGFGCSEGSIEGIPDLYGRVDELIAAVRSDDLAFLVLFSTPARDMTRQAAYLVRTNLMLDGYSDVESMALAQQYEKSQVAALAGASYEQYISTIDKFVNHPFFQRLEALGGNVILDRQEYDELQSSQSFLVSTDMFLSSVTLPILAIRALENTSHNMCIVETGSLNAVVSHVNLNDTK